MIDKPERKEPRFPPEKEGVVRERLEQQLDRWGIGEGDLAICGGARGADLIFAELCADRGSEVWLFIALEEKEFLKESVRLPGGDWEKRFHDARDRGNVRSFFLEEERGADARTESVFARTNTWMIDTGIEQAGDARNLFAILVWDEQETGEGPGGTSDFASRVTRLGGQVAIINPINLKEGE
ncbi:MAG TPA: hypothetical protein VNH22_16160 [Blastocatellia bacterium]|jgi:hypothetical protein|nr:hypothetical protein [Blastocatellia bacterium]